MQRCCAVAAVVQSDKEGEVCMGCPVLALLAQMSFFGVEWCCAYRQHWAHHSLANEQRAVPVLHAGVLCAAAMHAAATAATASVHRSTQILRGMMLHAVQRVCKRIRRNLNCGSGS